MAIIDKSGRQVPFFIEEFTYESIATANFDPITLLKDATDASLNASQVGHWVNNGFLVRPNADGLLYGITWAQYRKNNKSLVGLTPQAFLGAANSWIECPYVKVYACNDATYKTIATYINCAPLG